MFHVLCKNVNCKKDYIDKFEFSLMSAKVNKQ